MSKEELRNIIIATNKRNRKNKRNRMIKAYLFFAVLWAWLASQNNNLIESIILGLLLSVGHILLNFVVFFPIIEDANKENAYLKYLIKQYEKEYEESIIL